MDKTESTKEFLGVIVGVIVGILVIALLVIVIYGVYVGINFFKDQTMVPYDVVASMADDIKCVGNTCNITFKYDVVLVLKNVAGSGSMVPLIGAHDGIICLNKTPELGDIVIGPHFIHMVHRVEGDWVLTRGWNNPTTDNYKIPMDKIRCVVGAIFR